MITLKEISLSVLRQFVEIAYKGDADLLSYYWGDGLSLQEAVDLTMSLINQVANEVDIECFSVLNEDEEIGYIVRFPNNLYSFSININHRTKENLIDFWVRIKEVMEDGFICMLYPQNIRAANWLKRCGMIEVQGVENNCVTLLNV